MYTIEFEIVEMISEFPETQTKIIHKKHINCNDFFSAINLGASYAYFDETCIKNVKVFRDQEEVCCFRRV